jgi:Clostripain family
MAEVCYEVRDSVKYVVGAEGFILKTGWPFHRVLEALQMEQNPVELAKLIVKRYTDYYRDYELMDISTDLSAIDLTNIDVVAQHLRPLVLALDNGIVGPSRETFLGLILRAHWDAQSYKLEEYIDLYDFCVCLKRACAAALAPGATTAIASLPAMCDAITQALDAQVVLKSCYVGPAFQHSHGLSVYFPWSLAGLEAKNRIKDYKKLEFSRHTGWGRFVERYLKETQRKERDGRPATQVIKRGVSRLPRETVPPGTVKFITDSLFVTDNQFITSDQFSASQVPSLKNSPDSYTVDECP